MKENCLELYELLIYYVTFTKEGLYTYFMLDKKSKTLSFIRVI